jgi:hypothetical protein
MVLKILFGAFAAFAVLGGIGKVASAGGVDLNPHTYVGLGLIAWTAVTVWLIRRMRA